MTVNVNSLSLVEGEQQKLVCDVRNYYPADIHVQWLREPQSAGQLPDTVPNVLTSSHLRSSNGTYSFSRFFLLTATLRDNGHTYTCRVEHSSLQAPIRRSVTVAVRGTEHCAGAVWALSHSSHGGEGRGQPSHPFLLSALPSVSLSRTNKQEAKQQKPAWSPPSFVPILLLLIHLQKQPPPPGCCCCCCWASLGALWPHSITSTKVGTGSGGGTGHLWWKQEGYAMQCCAMLCPARWPRWP